MTTKEANDKFIKGREGLTDGELSALICRYNQLIDLTDFLDTDFNIFKKELNRRCELLQGFDNARRVK
jgi:hypothetical protein